MTVKTGKEENVNKKVYVFTSLHPHNVAPNLQVLLCSTFQSREVRATL
jgi:hypothetical protein